jgi:hypothetical protein
LQNLSNESNFRVLTQNQRQINGKSAKTAAEPICCRARKMGQNGGQTAAAKTLLVLAFCSFLMKAD